MKKSLLVLAFLILLFAKPAMAADKDYVLPYPGILPDNILWPIKDLRDQVISLFIFDPVAKGYYYLLQSDKRVAASMALTDKPLAAKTKEEAKVYFNKAMNKEEEAYQKGQKSSDLFAKLMRAVQWKDLEDKLEQTLIDRLSKVKE